MKRYTRKKLPNIEQMPMDESLFYSVHCNKSDFMRAALINSILMVPFSYILAIFVITFGCMHAVQSGDMLKLVLYIGAVAIFLGREIAAINKLYGIYVKGFGHSLDNQGINTIYSVPEDGGCRHIAAMPWEKVGNILVCGNFMIVNIERKSRKAEAFPMPIFWSEDIESVSRQALYLWKRALDTKPEEREYIYAENEMHEVMGYVEERFGEIQGIRPVTLSNINLGIAVIPPAEERDYYTLCTLGAGAYRMPVDRDLHLNDGVAKHAEYMMILPKEWKMGKESFEDNQYSWPFDLIAKVATAPLRLDTINMHGKVYSNVGDSPYTSNLPYSASMVSLPLACNNTIGNSVALSSGMEVAIYQVVPITQKELLMKAQSLDEFYKKVFGIGEDDQAIEHLLKRMQLKK